MNDEKSIISNDDLCSSIDSNDFDVDEVLSYESIEDSKGARSKRNFNDCDDSVLIDEVKETDILCGRGGGINVHPGNRSFRNLVKTHQEIYLKAKKKLKPAIGASIVQILHNKGFRFLKKDFVTGAYYRISDSRARDKTCQALREGAANFAKANNIDHVGGKKFKRRRLKQKSNSLLVKVNKETKPPPAYHLSPMMKKKAILPGRKAFVTIVEPFQAPLYDFKLSSKEKELLRTVFEPPRW